MQTGSIQFGPGAAGRPISVPSFRWVTKLISDPHEEVFERKVAVKLNDGWQPIGGAYYSRGVHFLLMAKHQLGAENAA